MFYGLMLETSTKELYGWYILIILVIYMCMKSVTLLVYLFTKGLVGSLGHNVNASDDLHLFLLSVKCATVTFQMTMMRPRVLPWSPQKYERIQFDLAGTLG